MIGENAPSVVISQANVLYDLTIATTTPKTRLGFRNRAPLGHLTSVTSGELHT